MLNLKKKINVKDDTGKWLSDNLRLRVENNHLIYESSVIRKPKISSHTLIDLVGLNKYSSPGKTVLSMFGLLEKTPIEKYQTYKGGISEIFAKEYLRKKYNGQADIESFTVSQFPDFNQFPEAAPFSGVLDLMMHKPLKMSVEVKSKEMREYERIAEHGIFPRDQVAQGANQAVLAGTTRYMMLWVFLKPRASKLLKELSAVHTYERTVEENGVLTKVTAEEDSWIWGEDFGRAAAELGLKDTDFKYFAKEFDVDIRLVNAYREKALKLYNEFLINRRVERKLFSTKELKSISDFIKTDKRPE